MNWASKPNMVMIVAQRRSSESRHERVAVVSSRKLPLDRDSHKENFLAE